MVRGVPPARLLGTFLAAATVLATGPGASPVGAQGTTADGDPTVAQQIDRESAELGRVRRDLEKARTEHKSAAGRETKILSQLNSIDSEITLKARLVTGLRRKEDRLALDLQRTRQRLAADRAELEERREILRRRLRNIYKVGEKPGLQVLLGATSAVDLVRRFDWLLLVADQDRRLADDVRESLAAVRRTEAELARRQDEVRSIREESEREQTDLVGTRDERRSLLDSVRQEKLKKQQLIAELESSEKDLKRLLAELEERARARTAPGDGLPAAGTAFAAAKGKLPWPVEGKVARWFGVQKDPRFATSTFNGGIDIWAEKETDVIAVHHGRADYVDWLPGYGQCIIVNHGDGYYTLYAHTSKVFVGVGDAIRAGEVIASVGDTGSLLGDILHFEIRKDAEPINPAPWLRATKLR